MMDVEEGAKDEGKDNEQKRRGQAAGTNRLKGDKLQLAITKLWLMNAQGIRELKGACYIMYLVKVDSNEYCMMKEQLQVYNAKAQELDKGDGLGPPSVFAFGGLLKGLESREESIGAEHTRKRES